MIEKLRVASKVCDQCLFSSAKIVDEERKADVLAQCERSDHFFVCHKSQLYGDKTACCRGFYDRDDGQTTVLRLARALDLVEFVDVPNQQTKEDGHESHQDQGDERD